MNLATSLERAQKASTMLQAARLYNEIEHELELGNYTEAESELADQALGELEDRFPGVHREARNVTTPPSLSRSANRNVAGGSSGGASDSTGGGSSSSSTGAGGGAGGASGGRGGSSSSGRRRTGPTHRAGGRSSSGAPGRVFEGAFGFGGQDVADNVIRWLRYLLVAGIIYQLLAPNKRGKYVGADAFAGVLKGLLRGVNAIVAPVDPFTALGGRSSSQLPAQDAPPAPVPDTSPAPAPSTSGPGRNMFTAPFAPFPRVPSPFPLPYAPGVTPPRNVHTLPALAGAHHPTPLRVGSNPLSIGG